jgi:RNA polymerase sigma-70 factor (ECF subfamily)
VKHEMSTTAAGRFIARFRSRRTLLRLPVMSETFDRSIEVNERVSQADARRRFADMCAPFRADLYRFVFWLCRDRALTEDVLQETLLRAWKSIDTLDDPAAVRPWLLTIARRELARMFERKRLPTVDIDALAESSDSGLSFSESHELEDMRRAIFKLDVAYREPLVMQVLLGFTTEEIARHLQLSTPAVLTRLFRARQLLRKQLLGAADGEGAGA